MNNLEWTTEAPVMYDKLDFRTAVELSITKWRYIVKNNGKSNGLLDVYPEMNILVAKCGLCQFFNSRVAYCMSEPDIFCPLLIQDGQDEHNWVSCAQDPSNETETIHPWMLWYDKPTKKNAQVMLDILEEIDIDEFEKQLK